MADPAELLESPRHPLRKPCAKCAGTEGAIRPSGLQDCVYCVNCGLFQYNAPRQETGRVPITLATARNISASQRARILFRDSSHCVMCGSAELPNVGHLLSLEAGLAEGVAPAVLNDDENLATMCALCNSGIGKNPVPLRLVIGILMTRTKRALEKK